MEVIKKLSFVCPRKSALSYLFTHPFIVYFVQYSNSDMYT
jgi:hypothetical protein